ncbi:hypothetical protein DFH09DRAFT_1275667 [Mycena vulgaris]|nr:hypothetical protein DFH09DRAFT_1275667 [Mycena vulgaris]
MKLSGISGIPAVCFKGLKLRSGIGATPPAMVVDFILPEMLRIVWGSAMLWVFIGNMDVRVGFGEYRRRMIPAALIARITELQDEALYIGQLLSDRSLDRLRDPPQALARPCVPRGTTHTRVPSSSDVPSKCNSMRAPLCAMRRTWYSQSMPQSAACRVPPEVPDLAAESLAAVHKVARVQERAHEGEIAAAERNAVSAGSLDQGWMGWGPAWICKTPRSRSTPQPVVHQIQVRFPRGERLRILELGRVPHVVQGIQHRHKRPDNGGMHQRRREGLSENAFRNLHHVFLVEVAEDVHQRAQKPGFDRLDYVGANREDEARSKPMQYSTLRDSAATTCIRVCTTPAAIWIFRVGKEGQLDMRYDHQSEVSRASGALDQLVDVPAIQLCARNDAKETDASCLIATGDQLASGEPLGESWQSAAQPSHGTTDLASRLPLPSNKKVAVVRRTSPGCGEMAAYEQPG